MKILLTLLLVAALTGCAYMMPTEIPLDGGRWVLRGGTYHYETGEEMGTVVVTVGF